MFFPLSLFGPLRSDNSAFSRKYPKLEWNGEPVGPLLPLGIVCIGGDERGPYVHGNSWEDIARFALSELAWGLVDGPGISHEGRLGFWWRGVHHLLEPLEFSALVFLESRDDEEMKDMSVRVFEEVVWGQGGSLVSDGRIRGLLSGLSAKLDTAGVPRRYGYQGGKIVRE
jgi:hypothetical protein